MIQAYQGLEEEKVDQKSPGPPGWGLMQQASPLIIEKRKLLKSTLEILWNVKAHQEEENEVDLNLPGRKGFRGLMGEKGLMEEEWNDRGNWRNKII